MKSHHSVVPPYQRRWKVMRTCVEQSCATTTPSMFGPCSIVCNPPGARFVALSSRLRRLAVPVTPPVSVTVAMLPATAASRPETVKPAPPAGVSLRTLYAVPPVTDAVMTACLTEPSAHVARTSHCWVLRALSEVSVRIAPFPAITAPCANACPKVTSCVPVPSTLRVVTSVAGPPPATCLPPEASPLPREALAANSHEYRPGIAGPAYSAISQET